MEWEEAVTRSLDRIERIQEEQEKTLEAIVSSLEQIKRALGIDRENSSEIRIAK